MPTPPRRPQVPRLRPPSAPRFDLGPLRLSPVRAAGSVELDIDTPVPFLRWDAFLKRVKFKQGEHITIVGTTGSGKTVLARELLKHRNYTVVLGTKNNDIELYRPFEDLGYELTDDFDATPAKDESRVIFRPRLSTPDARGLARQRDAFEAMLFEVFDAGGWTVYADEVWYLTRRLRLDAIFETFWTAGRSEHITVVAATQLPVNIPLLAFDQATHLFLFRNSDQYRIKRMSEFAGADTKILRKLIPELPRHEFVYVDTREGTLLRSMVIPT